MRVVGLKINDKPKKEEKSEIVKPIAEVPTKETVVKTVKKIKDKD